MHAGTSVTTPRGLASAEVLIGGEPQPLYRRHDGRHFTAGVLMQPYAVRVRNRAGQRIEVIATVDGRHVLDDEPGDPQRCHGMVIAAGGLYEFRGWRISDEETGEFTFGLPGAAVATRATGSAANVGVIGIAVHRERPAYAAAFETRSYAPVSYAAGAASGMVAKGMSAAPGNLGTSMGAVRHDPVGRTEFERDGSGPDITVIGYDTEEALRAMGLLRPADPDAFPAAGLTGYAKFTG